MSIMLRVRTLPTGFFDPERS